MEFKIFETIKEAFETSTHNDNRFLKALKSVRWEAEFTADGEFYFCLGALTFTTPSLNPFEVTKDWAACAMFADGSTIYLH